MKKFRIYQACTTLAAIATVAGAGYRIDTAPDAGHTGGDGE